MDISSDDSSLIKDCISGKQEAWNVFVERFSRLVYYSINKVTYVCNLNQDDIEDIFSGVFLSLLENDYNKLKRFEGKKGCTLSSWIRLITIRHSIDFLRKQKNQISIDNETYTSRILNNSLADNKLSIIERMELSENERIIKKTIELLPSSDRLFMELYYNKELPPEDIADIMNISVNTVYSKKNRIRGKLVKILSDQGFIA